MKCPENFITVRVDQKSINELFVNKITRVDGSEVDMSINTPAAEMDDRAATIFVQIGTVELVGKNIEEIIPGDTAIISYEIFNDPSKIISRDENGILFLVNPTTTYHDSDNVAFGNQRNHRMQLVWEKGEVNEASQLLGIVRDGLILANGPYVFFYYVNNKKDKQAWIVEEEDKDIVRSRVLSISKVSEEKYFVKKNDFVLFRYLDSFDVKIGDTTFVLVNDSDMIMVEESIMQPA